MTDRPDSPETIYAQVDPKRWDPFSRVDRIARVHDYCVHRETTDDMLRRSLEFMEKKVDLARRDEGESKHRVLEKQRKRNLFNYRYIPAPEPDPDTTTGRVTLHSHASEYIINCIQISELALTRGHERAAHRCRYYRAKLREGYWIEEQFLSDKSETANTFFLMSKLEQSLAELRSQSAEVPDWRLPKKLSKETLSDAFRRLRAESLFNFSDIVRGSGADQQREFSFGNASSEAFFSINHEIVENAMSHGIISTINPHAARSDLQDFGRVFFLQTSTEYYTTHATSTSEHFPEGFDRFHRTASGSRFRGRQKYRIITYYDTGLGVQQHLKKFGENPYISNIAEIARRRLSARPTLGSGRGFEKMQMFAAGLGAFLAISTPDSVYSFNGIESSEIESSDTRISRGTLVSIFLPER